MILSRRYVEQEIGVFKHGFTHTMGEGDEIQLGTFPPRKFHGWNKVTISGNKDYYFYLVLQCQRGNIQADAHVHTLLLNIGHQIVTRNAYLSPVGFQFPGPNLPSSVNQFPKSEGKAGKPGQVTMQDLVAGRGICGSEVNGCAAQRLSRCRLQGRGIVEENAIQPLIRQQGVMPDELGKCMNVPSVGRTFGGSQLRFKESPVYQDRIIERHSAVPIKKWPPGRWGSKTLLHVTRKAAVSYLTVSIGSETSAFNPRYTRPCQMKRNRVQILEAQAQCIGIKGQVVKFGKLWGNRPGARDQGFVVWGFGHQAQGIAFGGPDAVLVGNFDDQCGGGAHTNHLSPLDGPWLPAHTFPVAPHWAAGFDSPSVGARRRSSVAPFLRPSVYGGCRGGALGRAGSPTRSVNPVASATLLFDSNGGGSQLRSEIPTMSQATSTLLPVSFHGDTLYIVSHNGEPYTPMRPIVESMGLYWSAQRVKLQDNAARWGVSIIDIPSTVSITDTVGASIIETPSTVSIIDTVAGAKDGRRREMLCLPLRKLPGYLAAIQPGRVSAHTRVKILQYQNECDDALWAYWRSKATPAPQLPAPPITEEQCSAAAIRFILDRLNTGRWICTMGKDQNLELREVSPTAVLIKPDELPKLLRDSTSGVIPRSLLLPIIQAAADRLSSLQPAPKGVAK